MFWKKCFSFIFVTAFVTMALTGTVGAATYSDYTSGDIMLSRPALSPTHNYLPFIQYREFDLGNANLNEGTGVTNGDIVTLFNIDENTFITEFGLRVTTAAVASASGTSAEVGDGTNIDGFVGNDITSHGVPFVDLSKTYSGISRWNLDAFPIADGWNDGGATSYVLSGVSGTVAIQDNSGLTIFSTYEFESNHGPFLTGGASPYLSADTVDMTIYVDKSHNPGTSATGVTPVFEAYIKGFKRVVD